MAALKSRSALFSSTVTEKVSTGKRGCVWSVLWSQQDKDEWEKRSSRLIADVLGRMELGSGMRRIKEVKLSCNNGSSYSNTNEGMKNASAAAEDSNHYFKEDDQKYVKTMKEAQPYFQAHRGSIFVVILSAEIVQSSYLPSILEVHCVPIVICLFVIFHGTNTKLKSKSMNQKPWHVVGTLKLILSSRNSGKTTQNSDKWWK